MPSTSRRVRPPRWRGPPPCRPRGRSPAGDASSGRGPSPLRRPRRGGGRACRGPARPGRRGGRRTSCRRRFAARRSTPSQTPLPAALSRAAAIATATHTPCPPDAGRSALARPARTTVARQATCPTNKPGASPAGPGDHAADSVAGAVRWFQQVLDAVELAPFVAQVGRQPRREADPDEGDADDGARDHVGDLLGRERRARHTAVAEEDGHRADDDGAGAEDPVPLRSQPGFEVHGRHPRVSDELDHGAGRRGGGHQQEIDGGQVEQAGPDPPDGQPSCRPPVPGRPPLRAAPGVPVAAPVPAPVAPPATVPAPDTACPAGVPPVDRTGAPRPLRGPRRRRRRPTTGSVLSPLGRLGRRGLLRESAQSGRPVSIGARAAGDTAASARPNV